MKRKDFIRMTALTGGYLAASRYQQRQKAHQQKMLLEFLQQNFRNSLYLLLSLNPEQLTGSSLVILIQSIKKVGTCWMSDWKTCRKAVESGVNVLITHEPTFYTHWDLDEKEGDYFCIT